MILAASDPLAKVVASAITGGHLDALAALLDQNAGLATASIGPRSLLHLATDWPGNFPDSAATVHLLADRGADVNATFTGGSHRETPLHWAASCDDVAALDALVARGANLEAPGAVIAGGTPLADAVAFGQWKAARRLVEHGACTTLWQAAALGLTGRVESYFSPQAGWMPTPEETTQALWCACHGGQLGAAQYLAARGGDLQWVGYDKLSPLGAALRAQAPPALLAWLRAAGALHKS